MSSTVVGRDLATGDLIRVTCSGGLITAMTRTRDTTAEAGWLSPGFLDVQVNGFAGHDVNAADPSPEAIAAITDELAKAGVLGWVPTVITGSQDEIITRLRAVQQARTTHPAVAAAVPFAHVEGPFLSDLDGPRGAHPKQHVRTIDADEVARWAEVAQIGYVTVSPHDDQAPREIARILSLGIAVAVGHTHADSGQIRAAADAGATLSTHLGNGIFSSLPRHPNPIWTQLADDRLTAGLIGDGHHLPAETLTAMVRAKGRGRCFLVSDSADLAGMEPGLYTRAIGGDVELSANGRLAMAGSDILAGSAVSLADVVRWVVGHTPFSLAEVVELASRTPAAVVAACGGQRMAEVRVGGQADLLVLDNDGSVREVVRAGVRIA